jgi:hypothetical protein
MKKWKENISWRWCTFESGEHVKFNDLFYLQEDKMSEIKNNKKKMSEIKKFIEIYGKPPTKCWSVLYIWS